ncbi:DUF7919 family protein [Streptomyces yaanensis]
MAEDIRKWVTPYRTIRSPPRPWIETRSGRAVPPCGRKDLPRLRPRRDAHLANIIDLGSLRKHASRGWHSCTLCPEYTEHTATSARAGFAYRLGHAEIRAVSDDGVLYAAPNLIIHYVVDHLYGLPAEFIDAVRSEVRRR